MANPTLTEGLAYCRLRAQDNDASVIDADLTTIINKWYMLWTDEVDPRITYLGGASFSDIIIGTGNYIFTPATSNVIADILEVKYEATSNSSIVGSPMERVTLTDMMRFLGTSQTVGVPTKWALERLQSSATPGGIRVWIYPPNSVGSVYFSAQVRQWVTALSDGGDKMDVANPDAYRILLLASAELAWLIGKPADFITGILSEVGDKGKVLVRRWQNIVRPRIEGPPEAV